MDRKVRTANQTPAEELKAKATAALYAVAEFLDAARRAENATAIEAGEFSIEALVTAVQVIAEPPGKDALPSNVIPFPGRR